MAIKREGDKFDLYYKNQSRFKWVVLGMSILICISSIFYTDHLVERLKDREKKQAELFAKAIELFASDFDNNGSSGWVFITEEIIQGNHTVPTVLADSYGNIINTRNIRYPEDATEEEKKQIDQRVFNEMKGENPSIRIVMYNEGVEYDYQYVYYSHSFLLKQLQAYPYVQLSLIFFFGFLSYLAFSYSKTAEQNKVWIGLAKETAHQLGTPLSSLMAWVEYLKFDPEFKNEEVIEELQKDVHRLEMITNRFSNIGSVPVLEEKNIVDLVHVNVRYLQRRISTKVKLDLKQSDSEIICPVNAELFAWVIENLCKNAVDAMQGVGTIGVHVFVLEDKVIIDVSDTGRGIPKSKLKTVFNPGYSTKKRGWGLGLTLSKRIIEDYHDGKIFVKESERGKGTTFRVILKN
ncbi:MAG: HAMP domain-containing histidine kinase [Cytophagales bacterium]|nr:HAMP domain-containing histidine kinase [Cytophagales bacterium]